MKINLDKIREMLFRIEEETQTGNNLEEQKIIKSFFDSGLVKSKTKMMADGTLFVLAERLTWDGCEFLDTIRDDSVWQEVKTEWDKCPERVKDGKLLELQMLAEGILIKRLSLGEFGEAIIEASAKLRGEMTPQECVDEIVDAMKLYASNNVIEENREEL